MEEFSVDAVIQRANVHLLLKEFEQAIDLYTKALQRYSDNKILYCSRSAAYACIQQFDNAIADAEKTIQLDGKWARGYVQLGFAHYSIGSYNEAIKQYEQALLLIPNNKTVLKYLESAQQQMRQDSKSEFIKHVQQCLLENEETKPYSNDQEVLDILCSMQGGSLPAETAIDQRVQKCLQAIISRSQNNVPLIDNWRKTRQAPESISAVDSNTIEHINSTLRQLKKYNAAWSNTTDADAFLKAKYYEEALQYLSKALGKQELVQKYVSEQYANEHFINGDYRKALTYYLQNSEIVDSKNYVNIAQCYMKLNDWYASIKWLKQYQQTCGTDASTCGLLGLCYYGLKQFEDAYTVFLEGIKLDQTNSTCIKGLERCKPKFNLIIQLT